MTKVIVNGSWQDYDATVNLMDAELREALHRIAHGWSEQQFIDVYLEYHRIARGENFSVA